MRTRVVGEPQMVVSGASSQQAASKVVFRRTTDRILTVRGGPTARFVMPSEYPFALVAESSRETVDAIVT